MEDFSRELSDFIIKNVSFLSNNSLVSYGTAGFRGSAKSIEHLFCKLGLFAGLYCLKTNGNIGIMITASHNPVDDNGVKIIEKDGSMLDMLWEPIVEKMCNMSSPQDLHQKLLECIQANNINLEQTRSRFVLLGMDTRPSSKQLASLFLKGLKFWKSVSCQDYGYVTTPALHYLVQISNESTHLQLPNLTQYFDKLTKGLIQIYSQPKKLLKYDPTTLTVDCSNGVGYLTMKNLLNSKQFAQLLPINLINSIEPNNKSDNEFLNHLCGADYVKTQKQRPKNCLNYKHRYASLDGDADRLVYFYLNDKNDESINLLDGDKIASLIAIFMKDILKSSNLTESLSFSLIQTAYANGASTKFLQDSLGVNVDFTATGVKNLHHQALKYDIGIYFEANGHGTIWLSNLARELFEKSSNFELNTLLEILNNSTGDAVSLLLIVETALRFYDWSIQDWDAIYTDWPNSMKKVVVNDKNLIKTTDADRICVEPKELADAIDELVASSGQNVRCFIRPSGTENVVRIYCEANNQYLADELADKISEKVVLLCK